MIFFYFFQNVKQFVVIESIVTALSDNTLQIKIINKHG